MLSYVVKGDRHQITQAGTRPFASAVISNNAHWTQALPLLHSDFRSVNLYFFSQNFRRSNNMFMNGGNSANVAISAQFSLVAEFPPQPRFLQKNVRKIFLDVALLWGNMWKARNYVVFKNQLEQNQLSHLIIPPSLLRLRGIRPCCFVRRAVRIDTVFFSSYSRLLPIILLLWLVLPVRIDSVKVYIN